VVIGPDGHRHFVHAECARRDRLVVVEGAHLSREDAEDIWALADARARRAAGEKPIPFEVVRKRLGLRARSR
jgi:hypothetical protein